jgi:hypothetical protein
MRGRAWSLNSVNIYWGTMLLAACWGRRKPTSKEDPAQFLFQALPLAAETFTQIGGWL